MRPEEGSVAEDGFAQESAAQHVFAEETLPAGKPAYAEGRSVNGAEKKGLTGQVGWVYGALRRAS